jgi:tetratricopeptide (TPR) repeat protein
MRLLFAFLLLVIAGSALAQPYGSYKPEKVQKGAQLDFDYLDEMLGDLSMHARNQPARFDGPQDRARAENDVRGLIRLLDKRAADPKADAELLVRAAYVQNLGHNLGFPGAGDKADALYRRLLKVEPGHPRGSLFYGVFLAGNGKQRESIPHLEVAARNGAPDAIWGLGMVHFSLGNKEKALAYLEDYRRKVPRDVNADRAINAIRSGKSAAEVAPK